MTQRKNPTINNPPLSWQPSGGHRKLRAESLVGPVEHVAETSAPSCAQALPGQLLGGAFLAALLGGTLVVLFNPGQ